MIGGVCGGLAEYSRLDVVLWRVGFVVAAMFGVGVLAYLLLWVLMPPPAGATPDQLGPVDKVVSDLHVRLTGSRAG
jgi:phage shock protein PspC (stress-responsive transcriptional regulator)